MKILDAKIEKVKMTKKVIKDIIEIDKEFYHNFDYSDVSWYFQRYSKKNDATLLIVNGKTVGYFLFYQITQKLFDDICALKYDGDYDFPESEVNSNSKLSYLPSVLVKEEFREFSPLLLKALLQEFKKQETVIAITVSEEGKRMSEKFMKNMGQVKDGVFVFVKLPTTAPAESELIPISPLQI